MPDDIHNYITTDQVEAADAAQMEWKTCRKHGVTTDAFHDCGECWEEAYVARLAGAH